MKFSPMFVAVFFGLALSVQGRDEYASTHVASTIKRPRTYYSYSYKPNTGASVKVKGFGSSTSSGMSSIRSSGNGLYQRATSNAGKLARNWGASSALQKANLPSALPLLK